MARDRQRAKQRKARRAQNPGPAPSRPQPVQSAEPAGPQRAERAGPHRARSTSSRPRSSRRGRRPTSLRGLRGRVRGGGGPRGRGARPSATRTDDDELDEELEEQAVAAAPAERRDVVPAGAPGAPTRRGPARFIGFLRASWAELQRVQWPDRRQVAQATAVVIGFVVVAGIYLGVADWAAKKIVDFII